MRLRFQKLAKSPSRRDLRARDDLKPKTAESYRACHTRTTDQIKAAGTTTENSKKTKEKITGDDSQTARQFSKWYQTVMVRHTIGNNRQNVAHVLLNRRFVAPTILFQVAPARKTAIGKPREKPTSVKNSEKSGCISVTHREKCMDESKRVIR